MVLKSSLSVDKPGKLQHMFELIHGFIKDTADDQVGHDGHKHVVLFKPFSSSCCSPTSSA